MTRSISWRSNHAGNDVLWLGVRVSSRYHVSLYLFFRMVPCSMASTWTSWPFNLVPRAMTRTSSPLVMSSGIAHLAHCALALHFLVEHVSHAFVEFLASLIEIVKGSQLERDPGLPVGFSQCGRACAFVVGVVDIAPGNRLASALNFCHAAPRSLHEACA